MLADVSPVFHTKPDAPVAVSVVDSPKQMMDGEALIVTTGDVLTPTLTDAVSEQPLLLVPVTE